MEQIRHQKANEPIGYSTSSERRSRIKSDCLYENEKEFAIIMRRPTGRSLSSFVRQRTDVLDGSSSVYKWLLVSTFVVSIPVSLVHFRTFRQLDLQQFVDSTKAVETQQGRQSGKKSIIITAMWNVVAISAASSHVLYTEFSIF